jgi:hypothetical protein
VAERSPAPKCKSEQCGNDAPWSTGSRRYLSYCSPACRAPASRGQCGTGRHPYPGFGEKCKLCKRERDNEYTAKKQAAREQQRRTQGVELKPAQRPKAPTEPAAPVFGPRESVWRPAGIERYAARGGPDCPVT